MRTGVGLRTSIIVMTIVWTIGVARAQSTDSEMEQMKTMAAIVQQGAKNYARAINNCRSETVVRKKLECYQTVGPMLEKGLPLLADAIAYISAKRN